MTISIKIKEYMNNMPDTLNTKKEVENFFKDAMKKTFEKNKDQVDKPKKELNGYQIFMQENSKSVKEQNPTLNGPEVFKLIAAMWNKHKEAKEDAVINVETTKEDKEPAVKNESDVKVEEDAVEEPVKEIKKKDKKVK
jgi:HMG (high mobility group) box